jgi:hypothetical protein
MDEAQRLLTRLDAIVKRRSELSLTSMRTFHRAAYNMKNGPLHSLQRQ